MQFAIPMEQIWVKLQCKTKLEHLCTTAHPNTRGTRSSTETAFRSSAAAQNRKYEACGHYSTTQWRSHRRVPEGLVHGHSANCYLDRHYYSRCRIHLPCRAMSRRPSAAGHHALPFGFPTQGRVTGTRATPHTSHEQGPPRASVFVVPPAPCNCTQHRAVRELRRHRERGRAAPHGTHEKAATQMGRAWGGVHRESRRACLCAPLPRQHRRHRRLCRAADVRQGCPGHENEPNSRWHPLDPTSARTT